MKNLMNLYDDLNWEDAVDYFNGTKRKVLRDENGAKTVLLKLPKGFNMSPHSHVVTEQDFVLEGEYTSKGKKWKNDLEIARKSKDEFFGSNHPQSPIPQM